MLDGKDVKSTEGLQGLLRDLTEDVIESLNDGELTHHLGNDKHDQSGEKDNYRNGLAGRK